MNLIRSTSYYEIFTGESFENKGVIWKYFKGSLELFGNIFKYIPSAYLIQMTQDLLANSFERLWRINSKCYTGPRIDTLNGNWVPFQYPIRRFILRSRKVSKARDQVLKCSYRFQIWRAHQQQCCRCACQMLERSDNSKYKFRDFETLRDYMIRRPIGYWNRARVTAISTHGKIPRVMFAGAHFTNMD